MMRWPSWRTCTAVGAALLACMAGVFLWGSLFIHEGHNWGGDFALYISQARALLSGQTDQLHELNKLTMDHSNINLGPYLYPHGFPALLAPVVGLFGLNFPLMKMFCLLFFVGSLPLLYLLCRPLLRSAGPCLVLVLTVGVNYFYLSFADNVLSDFPYLFFSLAGLVLITRSSGQGLAAALLLGACLFAAYAIRGVGIVLLLALVIFHVQLMWRERPTRRAWLLLALPYLLFLLLKIAQDLTLPHGAENHFQYLSHLTPGSFVDNAIYYFKLVGVFFLPLQEMGSAAVAATAALFLLLVTVGMGRSCRKREHLHLLGYLGAFLLVQVAWPVRQGVRFLLPVMPLLLLYSFLGLGTLLGPGRARLLQPVLLILLLGVAGQSVHVTHHLHARDTNRAYTAEMNRIYQVIREQTPPRALVSFNKPRVLRLFTDRNAVRLSPAEAAAAGRVTHVLLKARENPFPASHRVMLRTQNYALLERRQRP